MRPEIVKMNELLEGMDRAILVTRRPNGRLVARPLAKPRQAPGADYWFVTPKGSGKLDDVEADPNVNVTFFRSKSGEWLSIVGVAKVSRTGSRTQRIGVDVKSAVAHEQDMPAPLVLFDLPNGAGEPTNLGRMEYVRVMGEQI